MAAVAEHSPFFARATAAPPAEVPSFKRRAAAAASMLGAAGIVAWESMHPWSIDWGPLGLAVLLGAAALGITRRSVVVQTLSRGAAWATLLPMGLAVLFEVLGTSRGPGLAETALAGTTAAALLLARPLLFTKEARADFAPKAYRKVLLAGSTATAATAYWCGVIALVLATEPAKETLLSIPFAGLTLAMLASAIGVARMRAWGILLGAVTGLLLLLAAPFAGRWGAVLPFFAIPTLAFQLLPILLARLGLGAESASSPERALASAPSPARARVVSPSAEAERYRVTLDDAEGDAAEQPFSPPGAALRSR